MGPRSQILCAFLLNKEKMARIIGSVELLLKEKELDGSFGLQRSDLD